MTSKVRQELKKEVYRKSPRSINVPTDTNGQELKVSQYYGMNVFNFNESSNLTENDKKEINNVIATGGTLTKDIAEKMANAVLRWATEKGATHFCHWFQPLTGSTAEKHDAFLSIDNGKPIEKLSASQLIQGEPDASSFPNGGSRSTFEARGYTSWDLSSPIFIKEGVNGKTVTIPTAFISYTGEALDIKTPLMRSISVLNTEAAKFLNLINPNKREADQVKNVTITCGCEQEYFLIDKGLYFERPDLVMGGRTVLGGSTSRNQQLDDHYFGTISDRALAYMQEVEVELYKLGIPAKTRHNEVAPGQYELAPIFSEANVAADQNQLTMAVLKSVAERHDFVCLLHEKPFAGINGSGKHLNWSMSCDKGTNLLEPTKNPHENYKFLATVAMICEAVQRHAGVMRASISSHGNDHRLGANEAPPSIISIFLGDTITKIMEAYAKGETYSPSDASILDMGADQIVAVKADNTDRNRTSPFAFTGNKFEFRAVGSSQAVGFPLAILNAAVADVFAETNKILETEINGGKSVDDALMGVIQKWYNNSSKAVFNGDGYSQDWVHEAEKRGLPNYRTTADALDCLIDKSQTSFLTEQGIFKQTELDLRYNVQLERYILLREIEFKSLVDIINKDVIACAVEYKNKLSSAISNSNAVGIDASTETDIAKELSADIKNLYLLNNQLKNSLPAIHEGNEADSAKTIAHDLMPLSERIAELSNKIESIVPDESWTIPSYFDLLFIR